MKALWDAQVEARDAHLKHMCTKRLLDAAIQAEVNTTAAFQRKRQKLMSKPSGTRDNPIYLSAYD